MRVSSSTIAIHLIRGPRSGVFRKSGWQVRLPPQFASLLASLLPFVFSFFSSFPLVSTTCRCNLSPANNTSQGTFMATSKLACWPHMLHTRSALLHSQRNSFRRKASAVDQPLQESTSRQATTAKRTGNDSTTSSEKELSLAKRFFTTKLAKRGKHDVPARQIWHEMVRGFLKGIGVCFPKTGWEGANS